MIDGENTQQGQCSQHGTGQELGSGCEREVAYCQGCIATANQRNYDVGVEVDCPPGVYVVRERR